MPGVKDDLERLVPDIEDVKLPIIQAPNEPDASRPNAVIVVVQSTTGAAVRRHSVKVGRRRTVEKWNKTRTNDGMLPSLLLRTGS